MTKGSLARGPASLSFNCLRRPAPLARRRPSETPERLMLRKTELLDPPHRKFLATRPMFRTRHPDDLSGEGEGERLAHSAFHLRLRRETALHHETLERYLDLLDPHPTLHRYRLVIERFHGFYAPVEAELPRLVATTPSLGFALPARTELLERDLLALGLSRSDIAALPRCADLPPMSRTEHLAGCLDVLEGASLGGRIIANAIRDHLPLTDEHGLSFFVGEGSRTGARWRLMLGWLEDLVCRGAHADEIVASARETFCSLGSWVELTGTSR